MGKEIVPEVSRMNQEYWVTSDGLGGITKSAHDNDLVRYLAQAIYNEKFRMNEKSQH